MTVHKQLDSLNLVADKDLELRPVQQIEENITIVKQVDSLMTRKQPIDLIQAIEQEDTFRMVGDESNTIVITP